MYEYLTYNTIPIVILSAYENIDIGRSAHFLSAWIVYCIWLPCLFNHLYCLWNTQIHTQIFSDNGKEHSFPKLSIG